MKNVKEELENKLNKKLIFKTEYSAMGWVLYSIGMSAKPIKVIFVDPDTNEVVGETKDSEELKKYVGR